MNSLPSPRPSLVGLPDDVICELFEALEGIDPAYGPPLTFTNLRWAAMAPLEVTHPSLGWIKLTHVSKRLRNIGTGYLPKLWARTVCTFPTDHAWETTLARSRSAPLTLDLRSAKVRETVHTPLPAHILSRTAAMQGYVHPRDSTGQKWWIDANLPRLKSLRLSYNWDSELEDPLDRHRASILEGRLFAPELALYTLQDVFLPFHAPSLRRLAIDATVTWTTLLECLRTCPLLEQFSLNDTVEPDLAPPSEPSKVDLRNLKYFTLALPLDTSVCRLLNSLNIPPTTRVSGQQCRSSAVFRHLLSLRTPANSRWHSPMGDVLCISATRYSTDGTRRICLAVAEGSWNLPEENTFYQDVSGHRYQYVFSDCVWERHEEPEIAASGLVNMLVEGFTPSIARDIRALTFHDDNDDGINGVGPLPYDPSMMEPLTDALRAFAGVRTLFVQRLSLPILRLLRDSLESATAGTLGPDIDVTLFPELDTLIIDIRTVRMNESEWNMVVDILAYYKAGGRPLDRIILMGTHLCHLSPDNYPGVTKLKVDLRCVKKLVGEVVDQREGKRCTCGKLC